MLADMGKLKSRLGAALTIIGMLAFAGCSAEPQATEPTETTVVVVIGADDIETIDDGIAWARSLDSTATAAELSAGIDRIGDLVPDLDIWFATNNKIGVALIELNTEVLEDPGDAGTKVDDLNAIVDDIEAAIEKGPNP